MSKNLSLSCCPSKSKTRKRTGGDQVDSGNSVEMEAFAPTGRMHLDRTPAAPHIHARPKRIKLTKRKKFWSKVYKQAVSAPMSPPLTHNEHTFNHSVYASKKSLAQGLMDVALLTANASQLKYVLNRGTEYKYYYFVTSLLGMSIIIQLLVGIALLILARIKLLPPDELAHYEAMDEEFSKILRREIQAAEMDAVTYDGPKPIAVQAKAKMLRNMGTSTDHDRLVDIFKTSPHQHVNVIRRHRKANFLNDFITGCIFVLLCVNTFISAFGLTNPLPDVVARDHGYHLNGTRPGLP